MRSRFEIKDMTPEEIIDAEREYDAKMRQYKHEITSKALRIITPHVYQDDKDIYGRNDISGLISDTDHVKRTWPKISDPMYNCQPDEYYRKLRDKMTDEYTACLLKNKIMKSYKEITNSGTIIDVTKTAQYDENASMFDGPVLQFEDEEINYLRTKGWYAFCPSYSSFTIRLNKRLYAHIDVNEVNIEKHQIKLRVSNYIGTRRDWMLLNIMDYIYTLEPSGNTYSLVFDVEPYMLYEEILTKCVDQMKWSKQEKTFWFDLFGINYIDKCALINIIPYGADEDMNAFLEQEMKKILIPNYEDIKSLCDVLSVKVNMIQKGRAAVIDNCTKFCNENFAEFIKMISFINLHLFTEHMNTECGKDGVSIYGFGNLSITSETPPVIPSEKRIISP